MTVAGQVDVDEEGDPIIKPYTKGKDDRTVFLSTAAVDAITEQRKLTAQYRAKAKDAYDEWALVFPSEAGTPVGYRNLIRSVEDIREGINATRAAAGEAPRPHWTPHDLRRTFGTRIAQTGAGMRVTQKLMGHKDAATTAKIYVIAEDEDMIKAIEGMRNRKEA